MLSGCGRKPAQCSTMHVHHARSLPIFRFIWPLIARAGRPAFRSLNRLLRDALTLHLLFLLLLLYLLLLFFFIFFFGVPGSSSEIQLEFGPVVCKQMNFETLEIGTTSTKIAPVLSSTSLSAFLSVSVCLFVLLSLSVCLSFYLCLFVSSRYVSLPREPVSEIVCSSQLLIDRDITIGYCFLFVHEIAILLFSCQSGN